MTADPNAALAELRTAARKHTAARDRLAEAEATLVAAITAARDAKIDWATIAEVAQVGDDPSPAQTTMWHQRRTEAPRESHPDTEEHLTLTEAAAKLGLEPAQLRARLRNPAHPLWDRVTTHEGWYRNRKVTKYEVAD